MFGNHRKRTIKPLRLWDEILSNWLFRNDSDAGEPREANFYVDLKGYYSQGDNVTYMYSIDSYPSELEFSYRTTLRDVCRSGVRMSFISRFDKHQIMWDSPQIKSKFRTWQLIEKDTDSVNEYNLHENLAALDSQAWRRESLTYLSIADIRRKRKLFQFRSILLVSGKRGADFDMTIKDLITLSKNIHVKLSRIMLNITDFMEVFSPFSAVYNQKVLNQVGSNVLTDELLARFSTYSHGKIGVGNTYWGTDIFSEFVTLKQVKKTTESNETWLITGESGSGKSYFVKTLIFQLLAFRQYNGTIMDIEGFEYVPLACYVGGNDDVVIINMAEGQGVYFDPVEIVLTGNAQIDKDMYSLSVSFTQSIFKTLVGDSSVNDEWVDIVLNDAVSLTYTKRGVLLEDQSTWGNSEGLTLYDVYNTLKDLKTNGNAKNAVNSQFSLSRYMMRSGLIDEGMTKNDVNRLIVSNEGYQDAIELCVAKVSAYFEAVGIRASLFRKRVTADRIINAKLIVCSFGMAGKSDANTDPVQMALMQLCAANISYVRSVFSKAQGKFNFKLWEEFQRWGGFPNADKTITVALTGGRKLGDINIIVTNKVGEMLDNDRFGVFSNLSSIAVGCIGDAKVREELCNRLSIPEMLYELDAIAKNNTDLSSQVIGDLDLNNQYNKAFLVGLDRSVYTITRMSLPEGLATSDIFRTGIDLNIEDVSIDIEDSSFVDDSYSDEEDVNNEYEEYEDDYEDVQVESDYSDLGDVYSIEDIVSEDNEGVFEAVPDDILESLENIINPNTDTE